MWTSENAPEASPLPRSRARFGFRFSPGNMIGNNLPSIRNNLKSSTQTAGIVAVVQEYLGPSSVSQAKLPVQLPILAADLRASGPAERRTTLLQTQTPGTRLPFDAARRRLPFRLCSLQPTPPILPTGCTVSVITNNCGVGYHRVSALFGPSRAGQSSSDL